MDYFRAISDIITFEAEGDKRDQAIFYEDISPPAVCRVAIL